MTQIKQIWRDKKISEHPLNQRSITSTQMTQVRQIYRDNK
jgi:hypothetical protein